MSSHTNVKCLHDHMYREALWCEEILKRNVLVATVCCPPASTREMLHLHDSYNKEAQVLICGDFNYKEVFGELNTVRGDRQHAVDARNFLDTIDDFFVAAHQ